jgi:hypothetical protein
VSRAIASDLKTRGSTPNKSKLPHLSEELKNRKRSCSNKETYRCREEDQLIERTARPCQPALKGVTRRGLLIVLGVVASLEGGFPRGTGKLKDLGFVASSTLRQGRIGVVLGLLDLRGRGPCRALGGVTLLRGRSGLARHEDILCDDDNWSGRR